MTVSETLTADNAKRMLTLDMLKKAVETLLAPAESHFFDIESFLCTIDRDDLINLLNDILMQRELLSGHDFLSEDHVYLYRQQGFHLLMRFISQEKPEMLYLNEYDVFILNPTRETIRLPFFTPSSLPDKDGKAPPGPLVRGDDLVIGSGEWCRVSAYQGVIDFYEETPTDAFVLVAHSEARGWTTWVYDRPSLAPVEMISTSLQASRMQLYVRLLGAMKATQAQDCLEHLIKTDYAPFVRWEAMESLSVISPDRSIEVLKTLATTDPNPGMRRASAQSLMLSGIYKCDGGKSYGH